MKTTTLDKLAITLAGLLAFIVIPVHADNFGTAGNEFTIDVANIGIHQTAPAQAAAIAVREILPASIANSNSK